MTKPPSRELLLAAQLTDATLAKGLAKHGLQTGWFDLLAALRRAGRPYELTPTQLMRATMLSSGGITHVGNEERLLDRLTRVERQTFDDVLRRLLTRLESTGDGRGQPEAV